MAHRRRSLSTTTADVAQYEVCLVDKMRQHDPKCPRRWVRADYATTGQLKQYWDGVEDGGYLPTRTPSDQRRSTLCRTHKEGGPLRKHARKGGWLYGCTPDGYIVHLKEYIGAESLSQRYFFLAEIKAQADAVTLVIHDDACHLRKFCDKHAGSSEVARRLAFPNVKYVVDRLHSRGHVDPWCIENCIASAPCNEPLLAGVNTSVCEQMFSSLGRHKFMVRVLDRLAGALVLNALAYVRNERWLKKTAAQSIRS